MFDPVTASLLRSSPALPGLDPEKLPQILTEHFANLAARRLREGNDQSYSEDISGQWPLARIADAYELITSITDDQHIRRSAAFVAGTAQQILSHEISLRPNRGTAPLLDRDHVDHAIAAALLFLAAEQYADAKEASQKIRVTDSQYGFAATVLAEDIRDLAGGRLSDILYRADRRPKHLAENGDLEERSTTALFEALLVGVEMFAADVLGENIPGNAAGRFESPPAAFRRVIELSSLQIETVSPNAGSLLITYPGPRHLAALLLAAVEGMNDAAITKIGPPPGVDENFWEKWLHYRAKMAPFMWHNHREAVVKQFHYIANSAVVVLPAGAGKTTVSCLKIASVLGCGKSVIFLAPTHALVEQLSIDLQEIFPEELLGSLVSSDFDRLFASGTSLRKIEVMTPEHCLALLSFAPEAFESVGLMVFDECHLLSPLSGLRRALDGMLCVLGFSSISPDSDFLFLSAMIRNGAEFAEWISSITGRNCIFIDTLWKPSRQARGIVLYERDTLERIPQDALIVQQEYDRAKGKTAKGLRKDASSLLKAEPFAMFGLHHNWLHEHPVDCIFAKLSDMPIQLVGELKQRSAGKLIVLKPNVNNVAAHLAVSSAHSGLKTIVFVNVKSHAVSVAREISRRLSSEVEAAPDERERWQALEAELGGREHSFLDGVSGAVPHHSQMIRLERDLAERMFRRKNGAKVIVATPTLAQGLNLPAQFAILASDMRADLEDGGREPLKAHELLNAAARAGRAGHLANGVVLLIPEQILSFKENSPLNRDAVKKLKSVMPDNDRCLDITDPLGVVLDRITSLRPLVDPDVEYALNRLSTAFAPEIADSEAKSRFSISKSLGAYLAEKEHTLDKFNSQVKRLNDLLAMRNTDTLNPVLLELAAQSGAPISVLSALRMRLLADVDTLPTSIAGWVYWIVEWLSVDEEARLTLLGREQASILGAVGRRISDDFSAEAILELRPGVLAWLAGKTVREIELKLGGNLQANGQVCLQARKLITSIIPMGLTFVAGLVSRTALELLESAESLSTHHLVLECLPTAVRRGYDRPSKLVFAEIVTGLYSRVQTHQAYARMIGSDPEIEASEDYPTLVSLLRDRLF